MDTVKIIQDTTGGYLAVSHHMATDGHFRVNLATSTDLLNWHWVRELAGSNTGPASQPTIAQASNGGFVIAWEQENPGGGNNHLAFRYFANSADLLAGRVGKSFDAPGGCRRAPRERRTSTRSRSLPISTTPRSTSAATTAGTATATGSSAAR